MLSVIGDTLFYTLLIDTYCAQPLLHVEAGACLLCHLVVPYDAHLRVAGVEVEDITLQRFELLRRSGVLRRFAILRHTAHVDDMAANLVVSDSAIRYLPRVHIGVLIVLHQTLYTPVEVDHVGVADLLPSPTALRGRCSVPSADLVTAYRTPLGRGGAVDNEILELCHS